MDEGFIDHAVEVPSISEDLSTVGEGADKDAEEEPPEEGKEAMVQQEEVYMG